MAARAGAAVVAAGLVVLVVLAVTSDGRGGLLGGATYGPARADPVPYDGRSPLLPPGATERVLAELPRPALGALDDAETMSARAQRAYVASLKDEAKALLSALDARGVKTRDVVTFERTWHGFAATVRAKDLPGLQSLGVRLRPDRRLFPAVSEPVRVDAGTTPAAPPAGAPEVALLAGGPAGTLLRDVRRGAGRAGARAACRRPPPAVPEGPAGAVRPHGRAAGGARAGRRP